jgi:hypothetical protein
VDNRLANSVSNHFGISIMAGNRNGLGHILNLITEIKDHLQNWQGAENSVVTWSIYMIGKPRSTAIPTVLFCSSAHGHRKVVIKPLQEIGILSRYPSMQIAGCRQHPASKFPQFHKRC